MQSNSRYPSATVAWFSVALLSLAYISSFVDRMIMSLLVKPIKQDLDISDTEMGLLLGLSFTIFYTILGLPIGWLADRKNRTNIIAIGISVWSAMTAVCGLANNYAQLFLARMGVGVGESALTPPAYSIITDSFPKKKLATAISVYAMGIYIGSGLAYIIGGKVIEWVTANGSVSLPIIGEIYAWQLVFFYVGLPGLILALLIHFFIKEPTRKDISSKDAQQPFTKGLTLFFQFFKQHRQFFLSHHFAYGFFIMATYGVGFWVPSFLERNFAVPITEVGWKYGMIICSFGSLGVIAGGRIADWMTKKGYKDAKMRMGVVASLGLLPSVISLIIVSSSDAVFLLLIPITFFSSFPLGAGSAALQEAVPNEKRGFSSAIYVLITNLVGLGLSPFLVGWMTDAVFEDEKKVGYSLVIVAVGALILTLLCLLFGLKFYRKIMEQR